MNKMAKDAVEQQVSIFTNLNKPNVLLICSLNIQTQSFPGISVPFTGQLTIQHSEHDKCDTDLPDLQWQQKPKPRAGEAQHGLQPHSQPCHHQMPGLSMWWHSSHTHDDPSLQGTVVDKFCCSAAADVSKCKGDDKWKYAGMVVKDKVCIATLDLLEKSNNIYRRKWKDWRGKTI